MHTRRKRPALQLPEEDAEVARTGEREIGLACEGKVSEELDGVTDVDDYEKRRPSFGGGEGLGVAFGLSAGAEHGGVPAAGAAHGCAAPDAPFRLSRANREHLSLDRITALLGLENDSVCLRAESGKDGSRVANRAMHALRRIVSIAAVRTRWSSKSWVRE